MLTRSISKISLLLVLILANITFAQKDISSILTELVGDYNTTKEGAYVFTLTEGGNTIKYIMKQFDYSSSGKGMYCWYLATPIYVFAKNFRASEELLQKISALNADMSPGALTLLGTNLVYMSYFWDEELSSTVLSYEIVSGFINTISLKKEIEDFMSKQ